MNLITISKINNRLNYSTFVTLPRWNIRKCLHRIKMKCKTETQRRNNSKYNRHFIDRRNRWQNLYS